MLTMFEAGFFAAVFQLLTAAFVTAVVLFFSRTAVNDWLVPFAALHLGSSVTIFSFLTGAYVLTAIGFALTRGRIMDVTANRIRRAAQLIQPKDPAVVANSLFLQSLSAAIVLGIVELGAPSESFVNLGQEVGFGLLGSLTWPAALSVGVAGFGATAHAARDAFR